VASFVLGMLFVLLFRIYQIGASAWKKGDAQPDLLQGMQVAKARLSVEIERSIYESLSLGPGGNGLSFLSAVDDTGVFRYDPVTLTPRWQKYVVVYFDAPNKNLMWTTVSVVGTPQEMTPAPIEAFGPMLPVQTYFTGGRPVARDLAVCTFAVTPDQLVSFTWIGQKKRYGSERLEKLELQSQLGFRNQP
jgi:hypothetical protein